MSKNIHNIIKLRRGTAAEWAASEPQPGGEVLKLGEPAYEKDTKKLKIGDGTTPWNSLPYIGDGDIVINPEDIQDIIGDGFLVSGSGINISYNDNLNSLIISTTGLQPSGNYSVVGHNHVAQDITSFDSNVSGIVNSVISTDIVAGTGVSITYDSVNDDLIIGVNGLAPVVALGTLAGSNAINGGFSNAYQTLRLNGTAVAFTKGSGWPASSDITTEVMLRITVTSATTITWTIVTDWFNQPPAGALAIGTHLFLLRGVGTSIVEGSYIGIKTN